VKKSLEGLTPEKEKKKKIENLNKKKSGKTTLDDKIAFGSLIFNLSLFNSLPLFHSFFLSFLYLLCVSG